MKGYSLPLTAGVDVGSSETKALLLDTCGTIVATTLRETGCDISAVAREAYADLLAAAGCRVADVALVAGTGYGRFRIEFGDLQVTEISCHARGAVHLFPATRTVLDMGGQDTKAIRVAADGGVIDFCMNDKCAAGTGRFLSAAATLLMVAMDDLAELACSGQDAVAISTTCTVFAESEILAWIARGRGINDILLGVHQAMANRSIALLRRVGTEECLTFTGGVSRNRCMVSQISRILGQPLQVDPLTHFAGALGAALFARDRVGNGVAS